MDYYDREKRLLGEEAFLKLKNSHVALAGLGGVGGAAAEAIVRAAVGRLTVCDCDKVEPSNMNRQLIATTDTIGMRKVDAAAERLMKLNPELQLTALDTMLLRDNIGEFLTPRPDVVIDAIDNVTAKLSLAEYCRDNGIPLITCLGTGNRLDATGFRIGTIEDTAGCGCPLAKVMRREMKKRGLSGSTVLYSVAEPVNTGSRTPATISYVPPVAGYLPAGWAVQQLLK